MPSSGNSFGGPAPAATIVSNPWNQLIVVNVVLAVAAVTVCLGAPLIPSIAGALGAGILLFVRGHLRNRRTGSSDSTARMTRGE